MNDLALDASLDPAKIHGLVAPGIVVLEVDTVASVALLLDDVRGILPFVLPLHPHVLAHPVGLLAAGQPDGHEGDAGQPKSRSPGSSVHALHGNRRVSRVHEYSLVSSLLERVVAEAAAHDATSVRKIRLLVGEHAGVEVDLLRWAFGVLRENTPCAKAELEVVSVAARWKCSVCSCEVPAGAGMLVCPKCDAPATLAAGMELVLERIELQVPD